MENILGKCRNLRDEMDLDQAKQAEDDVGDVGDEGDVGDIHEQTQDGSQDDFMQEMQRLVVDLEKRLTLLEASVADNYGIQRSSPRKQITKEEMAAMIKSAIAQGSKAYGVSRSFVRKVLAEQYNVDMSNYYQKKINQMLQAGIDEGHLTFDAVHQLYKLV